MQQAKKVALLILDGWGIGADDPKINAIARARMPFLKNIFKEYPHATLRTSGEDVGLPEGQMGNSEVGHLNIGAGRIVYQQLALINKAFAEKTVHNHPVLNEAFRYAKEHSRPIHLLGLVSDGGVHASLDHLKELCTIAKEKGHDKVFIHAFTDGRDTDPKSGAGYLRDLEAHLAKTTGKIASIIGRYYAMDRDKRWERVKLAYDLLVHGKGKHYKNAVDAVKASYENGVTDEFIKPVVITSDDNEPLATIKEGDVVLFFNFRTDRGRQLTQVLTQKEMPEFDMHPLKLYYLTMTRYDQTFQDVKVLFEEQNLSNTLGEVVEKAGRRQLRIAETEKYPHVTFFFSGGRETPFGGEHRILIPSPKVPTYDLQPDMSAKEITDAAVGEIEQEANDLIVLNFANPDMVGHTGVFDAVVQAMETMDECTRRVVEACRKHHYSVIIIADHGNADYMLNPDGTPNTAHTTNPVPIVLLDDNKSLKVRDGRLADVAPTILELMGIEEPEEMTGESLVVPHPNPSLP
jgi:2,3-bisphosphoglycerate-independent phosphoglycerate mutase